jgi:hypothetical protein
MGCSDPTTKSSFGSYRVLSPVAVMDSYAGVIIGNALLAGAVGLMQLCIVLVLRFCRRVQRLVELMATARFPSLFVAAALAFHTGTAYASSQLVSRAFEYEVWEVVVGSLGLTFSLLLPIFLSLHPYLRIGRAYQAYDFSAEWLTGKGWSSWAVWVLPRGAIFSVETRQAYGRYVSAYRAPPRQLFWTSLPTWTPLVFLCAGLFHPTTVPGCQALFVCMGVAMVAMGLLVVWQAPMRSYTAGWLDAASRVLLGCSMMCMSAALMSNESAKLVAPIAVFWIAAGLMLITALRILHTFICWYTDRRMKSTAVFLTAVWTHMPRTNQKKVSHQFRGAGDALLDVEEISRDRGLDGDTSLIELEDVDVKALPGVHSVPATATRSLPTSNASSTSSFLDSDVLPSPPSDSHTARTASNTSSTDSSLITTTTTTTIDSGSSSVDLSDSSDALSHSDNTDDLL